MILFIIQAIISIFLIGVILLQMQGSGLSNVFGGGGESFRSRRSFERILVWATIILSVLFGLLSIVLLIRY